jgi:hypothetical protein
MLFNPNWNKKPTRDWKSLDTLIAWLEKQPRDGEYKYMANTQCLLAQYLKAQGKRRVSVGSDNVSFTNSRWNLLLRRQVHMLPDHFNNIAVVGRTFGGALTRAKSIRRTQLLQNLLAA